MGGEVGEEEASPATTAGTTPEIFLVFGLEGVEVTGVVVGGVEEEVDVDEEDFPRSRKSIQRSVNEAD